MSSLLIFINYSLIYLFSIAISIFLFIVVRRFILQYHKKRTHLISKKIENDILKVYSRQNKIFSLKIAKKYPRYSNILIKILVKHMETIKGPGIDQLRLIYDAALKKNLLKNTHSRLTYKRLRATRPFVLFSSLEDTSQIMKLLNDKPVVRLAAINALSRRPNLLVINQIFETFERDPDPDMRSYMNVLFAMGDEIEDLVRSYLKKPLSSNKIMFFIELVGAIPLPHLYIDIIAFARSTDKEIRVKVAKALGTINRPLPKVNAVLMELSSDDAWEVSAQALKSLGKLKIVSAIDTLAQAVYSPHWYCRLNAGTALANLGNKGKQRLKQLAGQKRDRYAAEMAQMILENSIYHETG